MRLTLNLSASEESTLLEAAKDHGFNGGTKANRVAKVIHDMIMHEYYRQDRIAKDDYLSEIGR